MSTSQIAVLALALSPVLMMVFVTAAKVAISFAREARDGRLE